MNILFLTTHSNTGGITSYLYCLAKGLLARGHKVYLISAGGERQEDFQRLGVQCFIFNIKTKSELSPKIYLSIMPVLKIIRRHSIDIIHAQQRTTQVMGTLLGFLSKTPLVTTCHGFFKPKWARSLFPCWGKKVIAISEPVKTHLKKDFKVDQKRIALIYHGIDTDAFRFDQAQGRMKCRVKYHLGEDPVIGIIARLSDVKGHATLISAFPLVLKSFVNAKLFIVGQGPMEDALHQSVKDLRLERHVVFLPVVNRTSEILPMFDIFVMPSLHEGLGLSVMEAQAAGVPVVATNAGGLVNLIEHEKTGLLISPQDHEGLARAIIRLLENKNLAGRLALQAKEFINQNFSLDKMTEQTVEVYEGVCQKR